MKKFFLLLIALNLLVSAHAQLKIGPAVERIRAGRLLPRSNVARLSQQTYAALAQRLLQISRHVTPSIVTPKQGHLRPTTFQVQMTDSFSRDTASAFAIKLNGKIWGVTAAHVMNNISHSPYIRIETEPHTFLFAPIKNFYTGNPEGMDLSVFEIPPQVLPYVQVLNPTQTQISAGDTVTIPGFTAKQPLLLTGEKVLFAAPLRLMIQWNTFQDLKGFCGSPILDKQGNVVGVFNGYTEKDYLHQHHWFTNLPFKIQRAIPHLNFAVPVTNLQIMAKGAEKGSLQQTGIMMKVLGYPVAVLHPNEYIRNVELFRNGTKIESVHKNPFVDPEKLEEFFQLQDNDILRITLSRPQTPTIRTAYVAYKINVTTGEVTQLSGTDLFGPIPDWQESSKLELVIPQ